MFVYIYSIQCKVIEYDCWGWGPAVWSLKAASGAAARPAGGAQSSAADAAAGPVPAKSEPAKQPGTPRKKAVQPTQRN